MKNTVTILICAVLGVITTVIVMTVSGRMNRSVELQSNLSTVVETVVKESGEECYKNEKEAVAACMERLAVLSDTDGEVTVNVMKADMDKGVLAIQVMEQFRHPNGKMGKIQWERTAIRNKVMEPETEQYEVRFYKSKEAMAEDTECYKRYTVQEGERILAPKSPKMENVMFAGWKDINDYIADFSQPVQQNQVYYAQWE